MKVRTDVPLAEWCTLGVGGRARWFARARDEAEVVSALQWAADRRIAVYILGGGSNLVVSDDGFDGLVVQIDIRGIERREANGRVTFVSGSGEPWDAFVAGTVDAACAGLECLSGIPGLVGGTPVQNVGAYGQEVSGTITRVRVIDRDAFRACDLPASSCGFGYRTSRFRHADAERFVVTRVEFELTRNGPPTIAYADVIAQFERTGNAAPTLADVRDAVLAIRRRKGMVIDRGPEAVRSVGSFFVNPVVSREQFDGLQRQAGLADVRIPHYVLDAQTIKIPAAWLIERAGFARGFARGPVGISPFQAQAIVNRGGALAIDVVRLATDIKREVWRQFGIGIVPEPVFVGFAASPELDWLRRAIPADTAQA